MTRIEHKDNGKKGIFLLYENDNLAGEMTYTWIDDNSFIIDHTGVDDDFGGKGYGKQMVLKSVEFAREKGLKILPLCPFAKKVMDRDESLNEVRF